jgi:uncharacterized protein involved in exopolysaccharide biosynthesis
VYVDADGNLNISTEWTDAATAAEVTQAAREAFLRMRHSIEISAFEEKMAILDSHATQLRSESDGLAETMKSAAEAKIAEAGKSAAKGANAPNAAANAPVVVRAPHRAAVADSELPAVREKLAALKAKLDAAESERSARIREEKAKLAELKLRLTPNHPQVVTQEERVGMVSQVSSELSMMRADVADLTAQVGQREALQKVGTGGVSVASAGGATASDPLPADIMGLLGRSDADPALSAQISGAVVRYGALRDEVRASKIALDTAQAAFNHRYQVIVPVEVPNKPIKPKGIVILAAGLVASLLISLIIPVLLQLKNGTLVEVWQVQSFQLPILGQLRLPPKSGS